MRAPAAVQIITRSDIERVMRPRDYLQAMEEAFRAAAEGRADTPYPMHLATPRGGFHAKGARLTADRDYVAVKVNGNFPGNPSELGLPTVQGAVLLANGHDGSLLAVLDSIEVTLRRTAAASALAAKYLARPDSRTLLVCGCGEQGRAHLLALRDVLPIERLLCWDADAAAAASLAHEAEQTGIQGRAVSRLDEAALTADVIACCTSARAPFLDQTMVAPGTFVAAVGADHPDKNEITPALMANAKVVADIVDQCVEMGDLRHAMAAGLMTPQDVHAELRELVVEAKPGRQSPAEIFIFDSTGAGLQDVAAAAAIYERCAHEGAGLRVALGESVG